MKNYFAKGLLISLVFLLAAAAPKEAKKSLAPDFTANDLDQIAVSLSSFRDKKPVVLLFWTTWCPYCQQALKDLNKKIVDFESEGIMVLPINAGEPLSKVSRFAKSNGFTFRIFLDLDSKISDAYNVYGVPAYFLVDKKGYVREVANSFPLAEARALSKEKGER